ncbi:MAG: hypothetical protein ACI86H_002984, partial [bacterium]
MSIHRFSIFTKILLPIGIMGFAFLFFSGGTSYVLQKGLLEDIGQTNLSDLKSSLKEWEGSQKKVLKKHLQFNLKTISYAISEYLFNEDSENIKNFLAPYMNMSAILAIEILNDQQQPFAATWKAKNGSIIFHQGQKVPLISWKGKQFIIRSKSIREGEVVGKIRLFYTDYHVLKEIKQIKQRLHQKHYNKQKKINNQFRIVLSEQAVVMIFGILLCLSLGTFIARS